LADDARPSVITIREAAERSGVSESTLKRWAETRVVPLQRGRWTPAAAAQARVVARMRERGHSLREIRSAVRDGRLAFGYVEDLLAAPERDRSRRQVARELELDEELVERIVTLLGVPFANADRFSEEDVAAMEGLKGLLDSGFPLVALLQLIRVYAQSMRRIAEAEVRLFHLYVHEPLINDGTPPLEIAEQMSGLAERAFPAIAPLTAYVHSRYLRHYLEQDVVGHMEADLGLEAPGAGYLSLAFCFVDLTGFTRYTEEEGDDEALDMVERFLETVEATLPAEATIVKTIGDEVMVVSADAMTLLEWAVGFLSQYRERPRPRAGLHFGRAVYRDGDYFGSDVNLAHRVVARAMAGEVLVTSSLCDELGQSDYLEYEPIGEVELKGIPAPVELLVARRSRG
jgi:adenylate cyclase